MIDLAAPPFWIVFVAAFIVLTPLTRPDGRRAALAVLNLAFIALLDIRAAVGALLFAVAVCLGARRLGSLIFLGTLALFVLHKLNSHPVLITVGFAYVALRVIDLIRALAEPDTPRPDLLSAVNYLFPFHMLAAGPIERWDQFLARPEVPTPPTRTDLLEGGERIVFGLLKKYLFAHALDAVFLIDMRADAAYDVFEIHVFYVWLFLDFSAYSDIAVGIGRCLGIPTPENFDRPWAARNLIEFWERWHISLSTFIRNHVFLPLQLVLMRRYESAGPVLVATLAFFISFGLCGLWHDITWRFFAWGLIHAAGLSVAHTYRFFLQRKLGAAGMQRYRAYRPLRVAATFLTFEFVAFSLYPVAGAAHLIEGGG